MIYVNAATAQDIAEILRGQKKEVYQKIRAAEVADRLLGKKETISGAVITAPRQSGKTTELLKFCEEQYSHRRYCIVCLNHNTQVGIIRKHWELFNAANVAKRLVGQATEGSEVNPPLMLNPGNFKEGFRGHSLPIFVDEWRSMPPETCEMILETGLFVAAVTS